MNAPATTMDNQEDLLTISEMSARYYSHRIRFLARVHRLTMLFAAIASGVTVLDVIYQNFPWVGALATVVVSLELVFDLQGARSLSQSLYYRFTLFSGELASTPDADQKTVQRWNMRLHELYADEPPVYRALNAHVRNEMAIRLGDFNEVKPLPLWPRLMKNLFPFPGYGQGEAAISS